MAASALVSAFKALPGGVNMLSAARKAVPALKQQAPAAMKLASSGISQTLSGATKSVAKAMPGMSSAMGALSRAAPHLAALSQKQGVGSSLLHGLKALRELRGATKELSKMGSLASLAGKSGGAMKVMVGRPQKNWESATKENGFYELGAKGNRSGASTPESGGRQGHGIRIMVGRPEKNWEQATAKNGFRELGKRAPKDGAARDGAQQAPRSHGFRIMVGRPKANWEEATQANGFRELGGRKSSSSEANRGGFRLVVGHSKQSQKEGGAGAAQGGIHIQLSFVRNEARSGLAHQRVAGLSVALQGFATASSSRQRANSFDEAQPQRKHGASHSFPDLAGQASGKARQRARSLLALGDRAQASSAKQALHGFAAPIASPRQQGGRARAASV